MNPILVNGPFVALAETIHFSYGRFLDNLFEIWMNRDLDEIMNYLIIMTFSALLKWLP